MEVILNNHFSIHIQSNKYHNTMNECRNIIDYVEDITFNISFKVLDDLCGPTVCSVDAGC